jgi:hypothetical protein
LVCGKKKTKLWSVERNLSYGLWREDYPDVIEVGAYPEVGGAARSFWRVQRAELWSMERTLSSDLWQES